MTEKHNSAHGLAIVGIGCLLPKADNIHDYWNNIREGVDAITDIPKTHWNVADYFQAQQGTADMTYARRGGFISPIDFNPLQYGISPNNIEATDTTQLLGLVVARQALLDAGYCTTKDAGDGRQFNRDRTSVIMGVTGALELVIPLGARLGHPIWRQALADAGVDKETAEDVVQRISDSYVPWQENSFPGLLGNVAAGRIANRFDLGGTNCVVDAACASSLSAIHMAALELDCGRADMAIAGGLDTFNDIFMYMCFSQTPALSPTGDSRPFAADGDGTILGEGVAAIILKRLDDAQRDGDNIYAILKGIGSSSDGRGNSIYAPNVAGQMKALEDAYEQADVTPESIELVEAHGTGTVVGDAVEAEALENVYRKANTEDTWCAIGSVKSMIGHTKAAAGIAGMIKVIMALQHKVLPPSIKVTQPLGLLAPGKAPIYLNTIKRPWVSSALPRRAGLSAFGFGGSNFHCVLEEATDNMATDWDGCVLLIALSTGSKEGLCEQLTKIDSQQSWSDHRAFAAKSCINFDADQAHRIVLIIEKDSTEIGALIEEIIKKLKEGDDEGPWQLVAGACYAGGKNTDKTGLLFPGQGSQYVGMLRDLACQFPQFNTVLSTINKVQGENRPGSRISDIIYPVPVFLDDAKKAQEDTLRDTRNTQPALGAVSIAGFRVLEEFGFTADVIAGHSYGELVALCASGMIDEKALHQLSRLRGDLMARGEGDHGSMLAVVASQEEVSEVLTEDKIELIIANQNAPRQMVLSGASEQIKIAVKAFKKRKIRAIPLPVAAAFHSELVADAEQPFADALAETKLHTAKSSVLSNTTADCYPQNTSTEQGQQIRQLLAGQLARPVRFIEQIEKMYSMGVRTFIEIGPKSVLTGLVKAILGDRKYQSLALDQSSGKRHGQADLAHLLANLAVLNKVKLTQWDSGYLKQLDKQSDDVGMAITLSGANYVMPRDKRPPRSTQVQGEKITTTHSPQTALNTVYENVITLQKMQEQTAKLHQQYLQGQERVQQDITQLLQQVPTAGATTASPIQIKVPAIPTQIEHLDRSQDKQLQSPVIAQQATDETKMSGILLSIVAEKTGYPLEMLDLDMDMNTDLGIDSIKRVEILSAAQEKLPDLPAIKAEDMGNLKTLRQIIEYLPTIDGSATEPDKNTAPVTTDGDQLLNIMLQVVADKTGYPVDMLDPDMKLEDDLGIDSIKRVEILSATQERLPDIPTVKPEDMGDLKTLRQIIEYLQKKSPATEISAIDTEQKKPPATEISTIDTEQKKPDRVTSADRTADNDDVIQRQVLSAVPIETATEKIPLPDNALIWLSGEDSELLKELKKSLKRQGLNPEIVPLDAVAVPLLVGMIILMPKNPAQDFMQNVFRLVQSARKSLCSSGRSGVAILASITQLGGKFGLQDLGDACPVSGGIAGLIKTAAKEWPQVSCKAIDIEINDNLIVLADNIVHECLSKGPIETGLSKISKSGCQRHTLQLDTMAIDKQKAAKALEPGDVVVVTGGARGVTMEISLSLAKTYQTNLLLLGRSKEPGQEAEWLQGLTSEAEIKEEILREQKRKGIKSTAIKPRVIENIYRKILAGREIRINLQRIAATGVQYLYRIVDVQNKSDVIAAIDEARSSLGTISGVVHGAGILADRLIEDKTKEQFSQVYSTKVAGIDSLLAATENDPLKTIVMFSSSSARFGRVGQCDYAVANEVLNKVAQQQASLRKDCRVVSINWGPWDGGMVTPALKEIFKNEGIDVIPLEQGADHLMQEIAYHGPVEIVIMGKAAKADHIEVQEPLVAAPAENMSRAFTRILNVADHPFLQAHIINGRAVLPAAIMIEWMTHGVLQNHPSLHYHGHKNFRIFKGIALHAAEDLHIDIFTDQLYGDSGLVTAELRSHQRLHAQAQIMLSTTAIKQEVKSNHNLTDGDPYTDIYTSNRLFHGQLLQGIQSVTACDAQGIRGQARVATAPDTWMKKPLRSSWVTDPLALDSSFQLMILWCFEQLGAGSLPTSIGEYLQFHRHFPSQGYEININVSEHSKHRAIATIEFIDANDQLIARIKDYECTIDVSLEKAFKKNQLPTA